MSAGLTIVPADLVLEALLYPVRVSEALGLYTQLNRWQTP